MAPSGSISLPETRSELWLTEIINSNSKEVTTRYRDIIGFRWVRHRVVRREEKTLFGEVLERRRRCRRFNCCTVSTMSFDNRADAHSQSVFSNQIWMKRSKTFPGTT